MTPTPNVASQKMAILQVVATALALLPFIAAQAPQVQVGNTTIIGRSIPELSQEFFGGLSLLARTINER